jgi:hypothetical protein
MPFKGTCLTTGWTTGRSGFDPRRGQRIFPLASVSRPALEPTQPPVQWVPGVLSQLAWDTPRGVWKRWCQNVTERYRTQRMQSGWTPRAYCTFDNVHRNSWTRVLNDFLSLLLIQLCIGNRQLREQQTEGLDFVLQTDQYLQFVAHSVYWNVSWSACL